jgi:hypothetical protein
MPSVFTRVRRIPIRDCVHYCGFQYGREAFNPYENYILGLARGEPVEQLRARFSDFILHYRPRDLAEALGTDTHCSIPLWLLPWKSWRKLQRINGWRQSPGQVVDILTEFSDRGVPHSLLQHEYAWLERAWKAIREQGYLPKQHSYINVFELQGIGESRFLVLDGNHRLSALAALGHNEVTAKQHRLSIARRDNARYWPLVLSRHIQHADALSIFDAYFTGNSAPARSTLSADLV